NGAPQQARRARAVGFPRLEQLKSLDPETSGLPECGMRGAHDPREIQHWHAACVSLTVRPLRISSSLRLLARPTRRPLQRFDRRGTSMRKKLPPAAWILIAMVVGILLGY